MDNILPTLVTLICLTSATFACSANSDCESSFVCNSGVCRCPIEAPVVQKSKCVVPVGGMCNATLRCVDGATCDGSDTCECNSDRWELETVGLCLPLEGGPCQAAGECAPNHGLECSQGKCMCASFGFPGSCFKGNGSPCKKTSECTQATGNGELQCINSTCSCPLDKEYKANKEPYAPNTGYIFGECKIPINRRCDYSLGYDYECVTDHCKANYRCGCGKGATYDSTRMECTCQNGEVYNTSYDKCVCHGKHYGQDTCDCPGDLVPHMNTFSCSCPQGATQMPGNKCTCPLPKLFNSVTKACE